MKQHLTKTVWTVWAKTSQRTLGAFRWTLPGPFPLWRVSFGRASSRIIDATPRFTDTSTWVTESGMQTYHSWYENRWLQYHLAKREGRACLFLFTNTDHRYDSRKTYLSFSFTNSMNLIEDLPKKFSRVHKIWTDFSIFNFIFNLPTNTFYLKIQIS